MNLNEAKQKLIDAGYLVEGGVDIEQADDLFYDIKDLAKELGYQCFREKGKNSVIVFCCDNIDETYNFDKLCAGLDKILSFGANDGYGYQTINSKPVSLKVNCGIIHMDDDDFKYQPHEQGGLRKYWNESTAFTTEDIKKTYREYIENESTKMTWEEFGKLAFKALTANQIGLLLHGEIPNIKDNPFDSSKLRYLRK
jgi:hypothetical protein